MSFLASLLSRPPKTVEDKYFVAPDIGPFEFPNDGDLAATMMRDYNFNGDLLDILINNKTNIVHKWHHYIPLYDRYLSKYRGTPVKFLEIGVSLGGSLQMWRKYFGDDAVIFGIDIDPNCMQFDGQSAQVRIGSQNDPDFLMAVVEEMGGVDVVLDDGSHMMPDIKSSLDTLFPLLSIDGHYVIEDLHTSYMQHFGGGYDVDDNFYNMVRDMIDDMHVWYHKQPLNCQMTQQQVTGIHIHDSIVVLDKGKAIAPRHSQIS